ncbi:hypothetical protein M011DRAFT_57691 [Sporormia fimetaria CBS 119925]|uniref:Uncharacterized protein n=1 Tax=Sporormia fimetaria CBS 119925 TaxID=1340428 RepID=A0A6A6VDX2_9PLEO|nr:hypothetical protein M011DRAFT_57691 [Sporormia fimetaria CBS 119925]
MAERRPFCALISVYRCNVSPYPLCGRLQKCRRLPNRGPCLTGSSWQATTSCALQSRNWKRKKHKALAKRSEGGRVLGMGDRVRCCGGRWPDPEVFRVFLGPNAPSTRLPVRDFFGRYSGAAVKRPRSESQRASRETKRRRRVVSNRCREACSPPMSLQARRCSPPASRGLAGQRIRALNLNTTTPPIRPACPDCRPESTEENSTADSALPCNAHRRSPWVSTYPAAPIDLGGGCRRAPRFCFGTAASATC